jgi:type I restriction enzyme S subunit
MTNGWQTVTIGEVTKPITRAEVPMAGTAYRQIGVRLWGQGAYERETIDGSQTKYATLSRVESGDIIVNKIWARNGSVAVVSDKLSGCFGSGEFPTFAPDRKKLEPRWFHWMTKTKWFWQACDEKSQGTSGKNRIRPEKFLEIEIPLPPLDEQFRIIERIETLTAKIAKAESLREDGIEETSVFWKSLLSKTFSPNKSAQRTVEESCEAIIDNLHATPRYDGNEFLCVRSQDIGWGTMNYSTMLKTSEEEFLERIRRGEPRKDDIVFVREGDIGRCAVLDGTHRLSLGQRVMMLRPDTSKIIPNFLMYQLMSSPVLVDQLLSGKKGTTSHHLNISHFRKVKINVPPLDEQRRIVAYLDSVQARLASLRELQSATGEELSALLPSVLDRAFKGEL